MACSSRLLTAWFLIAWISSGRGALASGLPEYGGEAVIALSSFPQTGDCLVARNDSDELLSRLLHAWPFRESPTGPQPELLTLAAASPDGRTYSFDVAQHARFASGRVVDAAGIRESLLRLRGSEYAWLLGVFSGGRAFLAGESRELEGLAVESAQRLTLRTEEPFFGLPSLLAGTPFCIVDVRAMTPLGPVGAGPFTPKTPPSAQRTTESLSLVSSTNPITGRSFLDRISLKVAPSPSVAQHWLATSAVHASTLRAQTRLARTGAIAIGAARSLPKGELVAMSRSINRALLVDLVAGGYADPAISFLPGSPNRSATPPPSSELPGGAPRVSRTLIIDSSLPLLIAAAERLRVDALASGVSLTLAPLAASAFRDQVRRGNFDYALFQVTPISADPAVGAWSLGADPLLQTFAETSARRLRSVPIIKDANDRMREAYAAERDLLENGRLLPLFFPRRGMDLGPRVAGAPATSLPDWGSLWLSTGAP